MRRHAEFGLHAGHVAALAVHRVDDGDVAVHQLRQVLVAAADNDFNALSSGGHRQRADHVVGLDPGHVQHLPAHQAHDFVDRLDLRAQIVRHRRAVRLVLGIQRVAKGRAFGVEDTGGKIGRHLLAQALQHVDHAANGAGRRARRITRHHAQIGHRMKRAVQIAGAVHQQQGFGLGRGVVHDRILPAMARWPWFYNPAMRFALIPC